MKPTPCPIVLTAENLQDAMAAVMTNPSGNFNAGIRVLNAIAAAQWAAYEAGLTEMYTSAPLTKQPLIAFFSTKTPSCTHVTRILPPQEIEQ